MRPIYAKNFGYYLATGRGTLSYAPYPLFNAAYLAEDEFAYPVSVNGKTKMNLNISLNLETSAIEAIVLADNDVQKISEPSTT